MMEHSITVPFYPESDLSGIWQTVWLKFMPTVCVKSVKLTPNVADTTVTVEADLQGDAPQTEEEFLARFKGMMDTLPNMCGFSYTQLTNVELEQNGLYAFLDSIRQLLPAEKPLLKNSS